MEPHPAAEVTLAVLAGGAGTRMGGPKANLVLPGGEPMLARLAWRLAWPGPTLLVTAPSCAAPPGAPLFNREVSDAADGGGPLQGVLTGLRAAATERVAFVPVDMPLLGREWLTELVEALAARPAERGLLCVRSDQNETKIEPLPCVLTRGLAGEIEHMLRDDRRSLRALATSGLCGTHDATHWPAEAWLNLNTPADLQRFLRGHA